MNFAKKLDLSAASLVVENKDFVSSEFIGFELLPQGECIAGIIRFGERFDSTNRGGTKAVLVPGVESVRIQDGFFYRWLPTWFSTS